MKLSLLFFYLLLFGVFHYATGQGMRDPADSLLQMASSAREDTTRVKYLDQLSRSLLYNDPLRSLQYAKSGLEVAQRKGYTKGVIQSSNRLGSVYRILGNYDQALEMHLRSLQIAESISDKEGMARALNNLGIVYSEQQESQKAISYFKRTKELAEELKNDDLLNIALTNLGSDYALLNKLDSARFYTQQAYELVLQHKGEGANVLLLNLGNIHYRMGLLPIALEYYRMSIPASKAANDAKTLGQTYFELAVLFQKNNQPDSAKIMARQAMLIGKKINQPKLIADAGLYLASLLENDKPTEAFSYYKIAIAARDSMFRLEKVKQVERLSLSEQLRQQELEEARKQAEKERLDNLQLIGITVFIISFFMIVVLLSRRKVKPRVVEFLGLVALLLFFEFINLLMHGWFAHITHHTPVYMLLLLVILASILAPLHHYLTHWLKEKLVKKNAV